MFLLLICAGILWNIRAGMAELNELRTSTRVEEGMVEVSGEEYKITFGKNAVSITDSYKIKTRADRLKVIKAIQNELRAQGLSTRTTISMEGEWLLHNIVYQINGLQKAKNVDLEYEKDKRWYVAVPSEILGLTGV